MEQFNLVKLDLPSAIIGPKGAERALVGACLDIKVVQAERCLLITIKRILKKTASLMDRNDIEAIVQESIREVFSRDETEIFLSQVSEEQWSQESLPRLVDQARQLGLNVISSITAGTAWGEAQEIRDQILDELVEQDVRWLLSNYFMRDISEIEEARLESYLSSIPGTMGYCENARIRYAFAEGQAYDCMKVVERFERRADLLKQLAEAQSEKERFERALSLS